MNEGTDEAVGTNETKVTINTKEVANAITPIQDQYPPQSQERTLDQTIDLIEINVGLATQQANKILNTLIGAMPQKEDKGEKTAGIESSVSRIATMTNTLLGILGELDTKICKPE